MPKKKRVPSPVAKFKVGDNVRVKHGIRDKDYPDIPLGGWAGTITEVHKDGMSTIRWSRETLAAIHPVVRQRSEKDGTVLEEYWLGDDDMEPDNGGPLDIDQPSQIAVKPLSPKDQDDRIRMVFGLASNAPLPEVNDETLAVYRKYLAANLTFPIEAEAGAEFGHPETCEEGHGPKGQLAEKVKPKQANSVGPELALLFLLCVAEKWRLGKGEENDLLAGHGADIMMKAQHLDVGDVLDHCFHDRSSRFDQMRPHLLQQVSPLLR